MWTCTCAVHLLEIGLEIARMNILRSSFVILLCLAIALPTVAGWGRFRFRGRRIVSRVGRFVSRVGSEVLKPVCKGYIKVGCPAPTPDPVTAVAKVVACKVADHNKVCDKTGRRKRSASEIEVEDDMVYYPISDDFDEYDDNGDRLIEYEEFAFEFLARWTFTHPEQLRVIFNDADTDNDGFLDLEEFFEAPWDFGSYDVKVQKTPINELLEDDEIID